MRIHPLHHVRNNTAGHRPRRLVHLVIGGLLCLLPIGPSLQATENAPALDGSREPIRRAARYLAQSATPACAPAQLLADEQQGLLNRESTESALQWLSSYRQLNIYNRAVMLERELGNQWNIDSHNAFWLRQAQLMRRRDEATNAEHALHRLREPLDSNTVRARQSLLGPLLLQQGRFEEAAVTLQTAASSSDGTVFDRYNLALALIGQGTNAAHGRKLLDELSQLPAQTEEELALRDRINLALGWSWLAAQKGGSARPYFRHVRLNGPASNMALLGLGWAELAPNGRPQFTPVFMGFYHEFPFEPAVRGVERFRRALKPWQALKQRPLHNPPVHEALLAIAYTHEKLREPVQAAAAYRFAIQQYQAEMTRLGDLETRFRDAARDPRWIAEQHAQPGEFADVMASQGFVQIEAELDVLQHCRYELEDVRYDAEAFQRQPLMRLDQEDEVMRVARAKLMDELRQRYLDDTQKRGRRLNAYLARALLALAVLQDRRGAS